jgi:type II secretory pathway pseudopilin PulG
MANNGKTPSHHRKGEQGYILVSLTLFVALLAMAAMAIAPTIVFQIQRDREEEMIHRGVQYSRAIQKYFKKFQRYPTSLDDLEKANNFRFLRKRYKDPITGKDFKLIHYSELQMMNVGPGIAGATPVSAMGGNGTAGMNSMGPQGSSIGGSPTLAGQSPGSGQPNPQADASNANSSGDRDQSSGESSGPQIIGGPIVGVTSTSKAQSIREFGGKNHYNQWQFIYNPALQATKGLINTPAQPLLQGTAPNLNGQAGTPGSSTGSSQPGPNTGAFGSPTQSTPQNSPTPQLPPEQ